MTRKEHEALVKSIEAKLVKMRKRYATARELGREGEMTQVEYAGRRLSDALDKIRQAGKAMTAVRGW